MSRSSVETLGFRPFRASDFDLRGARKQAKAVALEKPYGHDVAEALTAFLPIPDPLGDETEEAIEEAFDELDRKLSGIGEVVGWDADIEGVQLHLLAEEPRRVMPLLIEALHALDVPRPWKLVATDQATGATLYERSLL